MTIKAPPTTPIPEGLEQWEQAHRTLANEHRHNLECIFLYTDSSLQFDQGIQQTGLGYAGIYNDNIVFKGKDALEPCAEVYNAEMDALAMAAEHLKRWIQSWEREHHSTPTTIHILSDNTGALQ